MTDKLRAAAQAVLKAWTGGVHPTMGDALRELSAALAEPACKDDLQDAEPFIWYADETGETWTPDAVAEGWAPTDLRPLYTAPPRREWVGLTDEEVLMAISPNLHHHIEGAEREIRLADARAIEAALKERNK